MCLFVILTRTARTTFFFIVRCCISFLYRAMGKAPHCELPWTQHSRSPPVQFKIVSLHSEKPTPSLRSFPKTIFETVPFSSDSRWPSLLLSRKVRCFLFPRLSPPGDRWCDVLGFVPPGSVSNSSTFKIWDASHLWLLLYPPVCLLGHSPRHLQGCTPRRGFESGSRTLTRDSPCFPFHYSLFVEGLSNLWGEPTALKGFPLNLS